MDHHVEDAEYFPPSCVQRSTAPWPAGRDGQYQENLLESFYGRGDHVAMMGILRLLKERELMDEVKLRCLQVDGTLG